jgi:hypothetical protein
MLANDLGTDSARLHLAPALHDYGKRDTPRGQSNLRQVATPDKSAGRQVVHHPPFAMMVAPVT